MAREVFVIEKGGEPKMHNASGLAEAHLSTVTEREDWGDTVTRYVPAVEDCVWTRDKTGWYWSPCCDGHHQNVDKYCHNCGGKVVTRGWNHGVNDWSLMHGRAVAKMVFAWGTPTSGTPIAWTTEADAAGATTWCLSPGSRCQRQEHAGGWPTSSIHFRRWRLGTRSASLESSHLSARTAAQLYGRKHRQTFAIRGLRIWRAA